MRAYGLPISQHASYWQSDASPFDLSEVSFPCPDDILGSGVRSIIESGAHLDKDEYEAVEFLKISQDKDHALNHTSLYRRSELVYH